MNLNCCHAFSACWSLLWAGLHLMYFINVALDSSNWIKICVDPSSRTLESCLLTFLWLFCWWLWQSLCLVCQVCPKITFCSCWNVWISPGVNTILFQLWILLILLSWCSFQSRLVNLMKSCQILAVSTNLTFLQACET